MISVKSKLLPQKDELLPMFLFMFASIDSSLPQFTKPSCFSFFFTTTPNHSPFPPQNDDSCFFASAYIFLSLVPGFLLALLSFQHDYKRRRAPAPVSTAEPSSTQHIFFNF